MSATGEVRSPLAELTALPLLPPETVRDLGSVVVVAPHPDDETLGCGGLIALLVQHEVPVHVLVLSDGTGSHPGSHSHPPERLCRLRADETREALGRLGIESQHAVSFLGLPDRSLPQPGETRFADTCASLRTLLLHQKARVVCVTWRRDPHADHRAAAHAVRAACAGLSGPPRVLEYPIWAWHPTAADDLPLAHEVEAWRLDIAPVLARKQAAIEAHRSQTSDLIDDDPRGFRLTARHLVPFRRPFELFLEDRRIEAAL